MEAESGNRGPSVRSDCYVKIRSGISGGIQIELKSKTGKLFGRHVRELVTDMFSFFDVSHAEVYVEDSGALPYVIAARVEAALSRLTALPKPYLLQGKTCPQSSTARDRTRRSRLYLPGDNPKLMINAGLYGADGVILDLEDSVAPSGKHDARFLVRNALLYNNFMGAELMVRINQLPAGLDDLPYIVPGPLNMILIPKCESAGDVKAVDEIIQSLKGDPGRNIWLMPIIESARGVIHAYEIASASPNVVALTLGLEDYTADIGAERTTDGVESFYARSAVVNAARAAGVQPIDSVFSGFDDLELLGSVALKARAMGYEGMGCIHPLQVPVVNKSFNPSSGEIEKAMKIVAAFDEAEKSGIGVIAIGSKMIDAPIVKRARRTIDLAMHHKLLNADWRDHYEG
ncbi:MAG: aldolase/citrate lyase family protein [Bacteroidota bacterium]